jgi:type II secretory pathway pseudopilin PulG
MNIRNKKGVTLIEVLAIMVVMAILASAAVVVYNTYFKSSELAMGQNQALVMKDVVAKYMSENNGDLPLITPTADYINKPSPVDVSKINSSLKGKIIKGNYYIYGANIDVSYDIPPDYIQKQYDSYTNKSLVTKGIYINTDQLYTDGKLDFKPFTKYLINNGVISQVANTQTAQDPASLNPTGVIQPGVVDNGSVRPTVPTLVPSKSSPYYNGDTITFLANSFSQKGDVVYEWTGKTTNNIYLTGTYQITVDAVDKDGNKSDVTTLNITVLPTSLINQSPTQPVITILPVKANYSVSDVITFTASATDPENDTITYQWTGISANNKYSNGSHLVSVIAVDSKGNRSVSTNMTFNIGNATSLITGIDIKPSPITVFDVPIITPTTVDPDNSMLTFEWQGLSTTGKYPIGDTNLQVRAKDSFGTYTAWYPFVLTVINRPPTMPTLSMTPTTGLRPNTNITFTNGISTDPDGDTVSYYWKVDSGAWSLIKPNGTFTTGTHTVYIEARDTHTGATQNSITFSTINTAPTKPTLSMSPTGTVGATDYLTFTPSSTDAESDAITYQWNIDNAGWTSNSPNGKYALGNHTISVTATDVFGAVSSITVFNFAVTNSPPSQVVITYSPTTITSSDNVVFTRTNATDPDGDVVTYLWSGDGVNWIDNGSNMSLTMPYNFYPSPSRGSHTAYVKATDSHNASTISTQSFTIGNSPPTIPTISMTPLSTSDIRSNTSITFTATGSSDIDGDTFVYEWNKDNAGWVTTIPNGTYSIGSHSIQARAKDSIGSVSNVATTTFTVNNTIPNTPTISMNKNGTAYTSGTINTTDSLTFTSSGTDIDGQSLTYTWQKDGGAWSTVPNGTYPVGSHTISVRTYDGISYSTINSVTFTVQNSVININQTIGYTGNYQNYTIPYSGTYKLEVWGSQGGTSMNGGTSGGYGGYSYGEKYFTAGQVVKVYVGEYPGRRKTGGWNGGGDGSVDTSSGGARDGGGGGGATDIRGSTTVMSPIYTYDFTGGSTNNFYSGSASISSYGSYLNDTINYDDSYFYSPTMNYTGQTGDIVEFSVKNNSNGNLGQIFFNVNGYDESHVINFAMSTYDAGYVTYKINMSTVPNYVGNNIRSMRFDLANSSGNGVGNIQVAYIKVSAPTSTVAKLIVAGGGGGGGEYGASGYGAGGGLQAQAGSGYYTYAAQRPMAGAGTSYSWGGGGGAQNQGGVGSGAYIYGNSGGFGYGGGGGGGNSSGDGGGGGGWYGGAEGGNDAQHGAGYSANGGGGSGYIGGVSNGTMSIGTQPGQGFARITATIADTGQPPACSVCLQAVPLVQPVSLTYNYSGSITSWTVPSTNTYTIETYGAQGGNSTWYNGGLGAKMKGSFNLTQGQVLTILVGGVGGYGNNNGGGGGGTFVTLNNNPLIISGGGGGAAYSGYDNPNKEATIYNYGNSGRNGNGNANSGAGGNSGYGGGSRAYYNGVGSGGAGLYGDGTSGDPNSTAYAGKSILYGGGYGGTAHGSPYAGYGGFGGGGGADWYTWTGGGGGGGYSGGGGGEYYGVGGGGGSFNSGNSQQNTASVQSGNGLVTIVSN